VGFRQLVEESRPGAKELYCQLPDLTPGLTLWERPCVGEKAAWQPQ
jgi:hypothetical protein